MSSWRWAALAGVLATVTVTGYLWLRCPQTNKVDILATFQRLRAECLAVYAEIAMVVALTSLGSGASRSTEEDTLSQILEQRLVLTHGLHAAACRVAESMGGGWTAADLETLIPSYAEEPGVKEGFAELQALHQTCLKTGCLGSTTPLSPSAALQTLRSLGERKASKLMELQGVSTSKTGSLGPRILQLCTEVEADFWSQNHLESELEPKTSPTSNPSAGAEMASASFGAAVVQLDAENESFQESYTKLMKDLEVQLPRLGTETTPVGNPERFRVKPRLSFFILYMESPDSPSSKRRPIPAPVEIQSHTVVFTMQPRFSPAMTDNKRRRGNRGGKRKRQRQAAGPFGQNQAPITAFRVERRPSSEAEAKMLFGVEQEVETADPVDDNAPEDAPTISEVDAAYFEAYDRLDVHTLMLNDSQR
eukprot:symbB.v1.2.009175.t2/scaffold579.1/size184598/9